MEPAELAIPGRFQSRDEAREGFIEVCRHAVVDKDRLHRADRLDKGVGTIEQACVGRDPRAAELRRHTRVCFFVEFAGDPRDSGELLSKLPLESQSIVHCSCYEATPRFLASAVGDTASVKALLQAGADRKLRNADGLAARDAALARGHAPIAAMLGAR